MLKLRDARKAKCLTQQEVANYLGISQNNYSYWENGKVKIDNNSLKKLADLFNVSVDYLLGRDTPKPKSIENKTYEDFMKSIGINEVDFEGLTNEELSIIGNTLSVLLKNFKKSNQ